MATVIHVQLAPSTTCLARRPASPVAVHPPHHQVLLLVLVLARIGRFSTLMVLVCAELVLYFTMSLILEAPHLTVCWTVSLRRTGVVPEERCVWQHPESVCLLLFTPVMSPVDHMEEL